MQCISAALQAGRDKFVILPGKTTAKRGMYALENTGSFPLMNDGLYDGPARSAQPFVALRVKLHNSSVHG